MTLSAGRLFVDTNRVWKETLPVSDSRIDSAGLLGRIHDLVLGFTQEFLPEEARYFAIIWAQMRHPLTEPGVAPDELVQQPFPPGMALPFHHGRQLSLRAPAVIMTLEAVALEAGAVVETPTLAKIKAAIRRCAEIYGLTPQLVERLSENMARPLHNSIASLCDTARAAPRTGLLDAGPEEEFAVSLGKRSDLMPATTVMTRSGLQALFGRREKYDVFVHGDTVTIQPDGQSAAVPVELQPVLYRLLVLFLRYKGQVIPLAPLYRIACQTGPGLSAAEKTNLTKTEIGRSSLRSPIARLRDAMCVSGFSIKNHRWVGYKCSGSFSLGLVLPRRDADTFVVEGLL